MARAIEWACDPGRPGGDFLVVNAGSDGWNHQVRDLANAVGAAVEGVEVSFNTSAPPDRRSYRVDFSKFRSLAPNHQPQVGLAEAIQGLRSGLVSMGFQDTNFRQSERMRLHALRAHLAAARLNDRLFWQS
jgi:nucleoside-diphosphate-sugar epimerase